MASHQSSIARHRRPIDEVRTTSSGLLELVAVTLGPSEVTVQLQGELDLKTAEALSRVLREQLHSGRNFVRLDLSCVSFLDCGGLRAVVEGHHAFLAARGTLVLTGVGERVARLLQLTHLDEVLLIAAAVEQPTGRHLRSAPQELSR